MSLILCVGVLLLILAAALLWPAEKTPTVSLAAANEGERIAYLQSLGYEVDPQYEEVCEVLIPEEFDAAFTDYNDMQKATEMDFSPYRGERLMCWSYRLLNTGNREETIAHLYVYRDRVVGGDITETVEGGSMGPLLPHK